MEKLTQHAVARMQQRGIKEMTIECLVKYGSKAYDHHGGVVLFFDKQARNRMKEAIDQRVLKKLESQLDAYAVITEIGDVVTVGHRIKRINRH